MGHYFEFVRWQKGNVAEIFLLIRWKKSLASDQKWPLSRFRISYQNYAWSCQKLQILGFQVHFSKTKMNWILLTFYTQENKIRITTFINDYFSYSIIFEAHYLLNLGPIFDGSEHKFGNRYEDNLIVIFYQWPKL